MTSRPPSRRLIDVLRQNSPATLQRHATELAAAASTLHAEAIQTRFLRNQFLISPKSICLLTDEELLSRWHVFGLYKPPFCPMREADAGDNYHHVSVESFVKVAMRSKAIYPTLRRLFAPSEIQVRVLHNLDSFASGPVLVAVSNHYRLATSLAATTMEYDVMVSGHLPVGDARNRTTIPAAQLFPAASARGGDAVTATEAYYEVREHGYYSVHPVSLLNVVITAPPTSNPPALERFVREQLGSCVVGDPLVMGELMHLRAQDKAPHNSQSKTERDGSDAAARAAAVKLAANPHLVSRRGDCDFPRVFMHLREVRIDTSTEKPRAESGEATTAAARVPTNAEGSGVAFNFPLAGSSAAQQRALREQQLDAFSKKLGIDVHCRKCFDGLVHKQLTGSVKSRRIGLLDGTWTPQAEFL